MTSTKPLAIVWATSLGLACSCFVIFFLLGMTGGAAAWSARDGKTGTSDISSIFIGSSLTGAALPPEFLLDETFPDKRSVRRWLPLITAHELEDQIELALRSNPGKIFVELRAMTRPPQSARIHMRINAFAANARSGLKSILTGQPVPNPLEEESPWLQDDYFVLDDRFDTTYLNELIKADTRNLFRLIDKAGASGIEIFFLSFPRASSSLGLHSDASHHEVRLAVETLALTLERPLFTPDTVWPDHFFDDRMHLNAHGRDRFLAELRSWVSAQ